MKNVFLHLLHEYDHVKTPPRDLRLLTIGSTNNALENFKIQVSPIYFFEEYSTR